MPVFKRIVLKLQAQPSRFYPDYFSAKECNGYRSLACNINVSYDLKKIDSLRSTSTQSLRTAMEIWIMILVNRNSLDVHKKLNPQENHFK